MTAPAVCPRCGKRLDPVTVGDGVPVCGCDEEMEHDEKYIYFNRKYWKVEDLKLEIEMVDDNSSAQIKKRTGDTDGDES